MGDFGAWVAGSIPAWPAKEMDAAGYHERDPVPVAWGFAVADVAQGLSARVDGSALLLRVARQSSLGRDQSYFADGGTSCRRPWSLAHRWGDRQPERENHRERRPSRLRRGQENQKPAPAKAGGRKRHILTDINGLLVGAVVHTADIQDRDGAPGLLASIRHSFPWLRHIFADGGYAGEKLETALIGQGEWTLEIIKRSDTAKGFELLPRRWVVERTLAWLNRNRRLAKDFEATLESSVAWLQLASVQLMIRRLANPWPRCKTLWVRLLEADP
jgi:transposase